MFTRAQQGLTLGLLTLSMGLLEAQQDTTARAAERDSADVLVLDHDFSSPGEFARVFLQKGQVYKAVINASSGY